jgi:hypothetical protein
MSPTAIDLSFLPETYVVSPFPCLEYNATNQSFAHPLPTLHAKALTAVDNGLPLFTNYR